MRVLVVDDSVVFRSQIKAALESEAAYEVVGTANNGRVALDKLKSNEVDLVTLDLEMPVLDGLETLKEIKKLGYKSRVIVFSSYTTKGSQKALEALSLGADDFIAKPGSQGEDINITNAAEKIKEVLIPKVRQFSNPMGAYKAPSAKVSPSPVSKVTDSVRKAFRKRDVSFFHPQVIVIGSSTGGPVALENVFKNLKGPLSCPILIAQHMPPIFTASLAKRLENLTGIPAAEGQQMETLENKIYVAPGDFHMTVKKVAGEYKIQLDQGPQVNMVRPAVDRLFESAAEVYGDRVLGIILTGMGEDGKDGCEHIKNKDGIILNQEKESCVVWGMPKAVHDAGLYDMEGNLEEIGNILKSKASR